MRIDFRTRILLAAVLPPALIALALATIFSLRQFGSLEEGLAARGMAEARQLADAADFGIFSGNRQLLERLVRNMSQGDSDITAATIVDVRGTVLARSGVSILKQLPEAAADPLAIVAADTLVVVVPIRSELLEVEDIYSGGAIAPSPGAAGGRVVLELSRARLRADQARLLALGAAVTLVGLLLGGWLAVRIARGVTLPVEHMSEVVRRIAAGDLAARVKSDDSAAVRQLEEGINEMAGRLATNREQLNARVAAATAELRARKEEAERAATAKSRFLAAASHDLRQPMHALGLFVARLGSLDISHEARAVVGRIEDAVAALDSLFDAMLDVSRIDAGLVVPNPRSVAVADLFAHVHKELAASASAQGLAFRQRAAATTRLHTDPALVERILVNLAGNALRYTPHGGVLLAARRRGDTIRLAVWDTGIGIPAESQQIIFDEYVQLGNPERDRAKGLGLGLPICHRLARLIGTRLHLRSVPGKGSVFWFDLPAELPTLAPHGPEVRAAGGAADVAAAGRLTGIVTIVDDDELVLTGTADLLASWGCRVIAGAAVADVLRECSTAAVKPDAAIVDYRLRGAENGLHAARTLRDRFGALPVMILTGDLSEQFRQEVASNGFQVMAKPVKPARLRAMLQHMLDRPPAG